MDNNEGIMKNNNAKIYYLKDLDFYNVLYSMFPCYRYQAE